MRKESIFKHGLNCSRTEMNGICTESVTIHDNGDSMFLWNATKTTVLKPVSNSNKVAIKIDQL